LLYSFNWNFAKVFSIYLNTPQTKIIIISFSNTPNPFQHEICQTKKLKRFPKDQICNRNNQGHADWSGDSRGNCLISCPPPNSSAEECEYYRHLK